MKRFIFVALLLQSICLNTIAQTNDEVPFNLAGLFNEDDLRVPIDNERYFSLPDGTFTHTQVMNIPTSSGANVFYKVLIIVDSTLYSKLKYEINRYAYDIHYVYGCNVIMEQVYSETCRDIKDLIVSYQDYLDGCVFIGDIAPAFYEMDNDYVDLYRNDSVAWPCDLYYMDLVNGSWPDYDNDGCFDHYSGDMKPEIFIGRISTANMGSLIGETEGMRSYMKKNHKFWLGHRKVNKKYALAYINKPWKDNSFHCNNIYILYGYNNMDIYTSDSLSFGKVDYLNRLNNDKYEFIQLVSHSNFNYHCYFGQQEDEIILGNEIFSNGIKSLGFNLFCCYACRWTSATNTNAFLAGDYIYSPQSDGLCVVGSTKAGGMFPYLDFYNSLNHEKTMGQALVDWWRAKDMTTGNADSLLCWNYGMTIIGDPLVNFFHCTNSTCQDQISLTSYNNSNSPLSYYLASESITVAPPSSGSFTIPVGDHCILNAPTVLIDGAFLCPQGSTMEILNEGCRDNCDD